MTATAPDLRTREARIYRVNAWREMKGREPLVFDLTPGGPEWWTQANTLAWQLKTWRCNSADELSAAQQTWGRKLEHGDHIARGKFPAPSPKQYREWSQGETRPANRFFYDGKAM